jgi:hypothetical protein
VGGRRTLQRRRPAVDGVLALGPRSGARFRHGARISELDGTCTAARGTPRSAAGICQRGLDAPILRCRAHKSMNQAPSYRERGHSARAGCAMRKQSTRLASAPSNASLRLLMVMFVSAGCCGYTSAAADSHKSAAADRVEGLYNGFPVGTETQGHEGYGAAQKAEEQLKLDFLNSFLNPQKKCREPDRLGRGGITTHKRLVEIWRR